MVAEASITSQYCRTCGNLKLLSQFSFRVRGKEARRTECKSCALERVRRHRKMYPPQVGRLTGKRKEEFSAVIRRSRIKHVYGITQSVYLAMLEAQGGVCAICHCEERRRNQWGAISLSIDHDHETGKVRGLLCSDCNFKLSTLEDAHFVTSAQAYLAQYTDTEK